MGRLAQIINVAPRKSIPYPFRIRKGVRTVPLIKLEKGVHKLTLVNNGNPNGFYNIVSGDETIGLIYTWQPLAGIFRKTRIGTEQLIGLRFGNELMFRLTGGPAKFLRERDHLRNVLSWKPNHPVNIAFLYRYKHKKGSYIYEGARRNPSSAMLSPAEIPPSKTELIFKDARRNRNNGGSIGIIEGLSAPPRGHGSGPRASYYPVFKPSNFSWGSLGEKVPHTLNLIGLVEGYHFSFEEYKGY